MLVGSILKNKSLDGYVRNNCLEAIDISARHDQLAKEMEKRNMKHQSPLPYFLVPLEYANSRVDKCQSLIDLISRCTTCRVRYQRLREDGALENKNKTMPKYGFID
jgi:hypothetical protein